MNEPPLQKPAQGQRYLAYGLLALGVILTLFNGDIGRGLGLGVTLIQFAALVCLLGGAFLFYRVRERADRVSEYQKAIKPVELPPETETDETEAKTPEPK